MFVYLPLYADGIQALRQRVGLPPHRTCYEDTLRFASMAAGPAATAAAAAAGGGAAAGAGATSEAATVAAINAIHGVLSDTTHPDGGDESVPFALPQFPVGSRHHTLALAVLAYCVALLKIADVERRAILFAEVWEEEDLVSHAFLQDLMFNTSNADVMLLLRDAEAALLASAAASRAAAGTPVDAAPAKAAKPSRHAQRVNAAVGVTVGIEPLPLGTTRIPADSAILSGAEAASGGAGVFQAICSDDAATVRVVDALVARLRLKRSYFFALLQLVRVVCVAASLLW